MDLEATQESALRMKALFLASGRVLLEGYGCLLGCSSVWFSVEGGLEFRAWRLELGFRIFPLSGLQKVHEM